MFEKSYLEPNEHLLQCPGCHATSLVKLHPKPAEFTDWICPHCMLTVRARNETVRLTSKEQHDK